LTFDQEAWSPIEKLFRSVELVPVALRDEFAKFVLEGSDFGPFVHCDHSELAIELAHTTAMSANMRLSIRARNLLELSVFSFAPDGSARLSTTA